MAEIAQDLKIEIRPIPNRKGIRDFSENLEYFSQAHIISPLVDPASLKYKTGLTEEDIKYLEEKGFPYDFKNDNYIRGVSHPFWESQMLKIELRNNPMFLFPGKNLIDFVKYKYLLESKYVYKSEAELAEGGKFEATHYIYNESEEIALKASRIDEKNKIINRIEKLSKQKKCDLLLVLLNENTENKDNDYLTVRFEDIIATKHLYDELIPLLDGMRGDISLLAEVKKAIQMNVLKRTKLGIFYYDNNLGFTEEDVRDVLSKPENQELYLTIKTKIK